VASIEKGGTPGLTMYVVGGGVNETFGHSTRFGIRLIRRVINHLQNPSIPLSESIAIKKRKLD